MLYHNSRPQNEAEVRHVLDTALKDIGSVTWPSPDREVTSLARFSLGRLLDRETPVEFELGNAFVSGMTTYIRRDDWFSLTAITAKCHRSPDGDGHLIELGLQTTSEEGENAQHLARIDIDTHQARLKLHCENREKLRRGLWKHPVPFAHAFGDSHFPTIQWGLYSERLISCVTVGHDTFTDTAGSKSRVKEFASRIKKIIGL